MPREGQPGSAGTASAFLMLAGLQDRPVVITNSAQKAPQLV